MDMVMDMVMATDTGTTATTARGRLSLPPLLRLLLSLDMATATDTVMDTAMDTVMDMVMATDTDTTATMARGRPSLPPLLRLLLSPDMATTATDTAMDMVTDMVMDMVMATDTAMATATMVEREQTVLTIMM